AAYTLPSSLHAHTHPRPPHSFPTRRSSDLCRTRASPERHPALRLLPGAERRRQRPLPDLLPRGRGRWDGRLGRGDHAEGQVADRSEEHTSELQSPCNLVCRLLLEKKK